jgi:arylsulfatase A-like enzyme
MKNIICLLVDRLHIGFLGAYGNAEIETPAFNRLASESFLADRFYVDTTDPVRQSRSWWRGAHVFAQNATPTIMSQLNAAGYRTVLVTDDPEIAYSPDAGDFSDVQLLPSSKNTEPCDEIDETHLCGMLATVAATAESLALSGAPYCLWCHLRGFEEIWDFPLFLREKYCGEGDPEPYAGITPPFFQCKKQNAEHGMTENTSSDLSPDQMDDYRQAVVSAYSGGVTMFDELLEMLVAPLRDGELSSETLFLLAGTRGVLFSEHGIIGIPPADPTLTEPLASSLVQVPLVVRFPDGFGATVRSDALLQPPDVTRLLCEWLELSLPGALRNTTSAGPNMLDVIREVPQNLRDRVLIVASSGEMAISCLVTPSWFLQELDSSATDTDNRFALYVKPDDRWDINNVADRCVEIVEQLVDVRGDLLQRLATHDTSPPEPLPDILRERYQ